MSLVSRSQSTGIPRRSLDGLHHWVILDFDLRGDHFRDDFRFSLLDLRLSVVSLSFLVNIRLIQNLFLTNVDSVVF